MRDSTLLYLIKKSEGEIVDICLAMKKRGFGVGRWNGVGGKVSEGESIEDAVKRETKEEIDVVVEKFSKVAELIFTFPHKAEWNQKVHVFLCEEWEGEPKETEEMKPTWFKVEDMDYGSMWPSDTLWLTKVIAGDLLKGSLVLGEGDEVIEHKVEIVESLNE